MTSEITRPRRCSLHGGRPLWVTALFVAVATGCEQGANQPSAPLSAKIDARVPVLALKPGVDPVAFERFLGMIPDSARPAVQRAFVRGPDMLQVVRAEGDSTLKAAFTAITARAPLRAAVPKGSGVWADPVTLILTSDSGAGITVDRSNSASAGDRVLVPTNRADVEHLSGALALLARLRRVSARPSRRMSYVIRQQPLPSSPLPASWRNYLAAKLAQAQGVAPIEVPGVGPARVLRIPTLGR